MNKIFESYPARYFTDNPPPPFPSLSYCLPIDWDLPFEPKLANLVDKPVEELRK